MSRAANSLRTSDVITTPIKLKYSSSFESSSFGEYGIQVVKGVNGAVTITGSISQETINYYSIRHLYYSNYFNYPQSTAASGTFDADVRHFPTQSGAEVTVISIPRGVYGQQISRQSFILSSSFYCIVDDGNGNLIDIGNANSGLYILNGYFNATNYFVSQSEPAIHVGNLIYPQGMAIITSPAYQAFFP